MNNHLMAEKLNNWRNKRILLKDYEGTIDKCNCGMINVLGFNSGY